MLLNSNSYIKDFLEEKYDLYNQPRFIESDPILIPHQFKKQEDIEISAFLTATIAWGKRPMIINNANRLIRLMDSTPHDFIMNASNIELDRLKNFVHRTFNGDDCIFFIKSLRNIYNSHKGLKNIFESEYIKSNNIANSIMSFRNIFFETTHFDRSQKHIANIQKKSSAKRINMFLRWMVRKDTRNVDFGIWHNIPNSALYIPLDIHVGNVARKLKLLHRKQNDWKAVEELTLKLRTFDPNDPVKYDYALFGLGIFEKF